MGRYCPGYGNALFLAAAEGVDGTAAQFEKVNGGEGFCDAGLHLGRGEVFFHKSKGYICADRGHDELVVGVLKDEAEFGRDVNGARLLR